MNHRIKVVGYINVSDLDPEQVDLTHSSGLSEIGHQQLLSDAGTGRALSIADLEDVETSISLQMKS